MNQAEYREKATAELREITGTEDVPPVFLATGRWPLPLKVGVREDMLARCPDATVWKLRRWLTGWCLRGEYLQAVAAGGDRFDLDNRPAGKITDDEQVFAGEQMKTLAAKRKQQALAAKPKPKLVGRNGRPILRLQRTA